MKTKLQFKTMVRWTNIWEVYKYCCGCHSIACLHHYILTKWQFAVRLTCSREPMSLYRTLLLGSSSSSDGVVESAWSRSLRCSTCLLFSIRSSSSPLSKEDCLLPELVRHALYRPEDTATITLLSPPTILLPELTPGSGTSLLLQE